MRLLLMKMCAIAAVNLVAGGAEGRNVITESDRTLQLKRDAEHLRTYQSTLDGKEERGFDSAAFGETMKNFDRDVLANPESLHGMRKTLLKSETFNDFFKEKYDHARSPEQVYRELEVHRNKVPAEAQYHYLEFMKKQKEKIHSTLLSTLAESVHPTAAESVHPTVADPVSTRSKDKGPAEIVGGQLSSKVSSDQDQYSVWLQNGIPPIKVLKLLELDEVGDTFLEDLLMLAWTSYVTKYNHKYSEKSTTVFDALKEAGVKEETMVNMVFSWDLRKKIVTRKVNIMSLSVDEKQQLINLLHSYQEIARTDILNGLREVWLSRTVNPLDVLDILGLSPNLETGFEEFRFNEWLKYLEMWHAKNFPTLENPLYSIGIYLSIKRYTAEQLKQFLPFLDKHSLPSEKLNAYIKHQSWNEKTSWKRKRYTS